MYLETNSFTLVIISTVVGSAIILAGIEIIKRLKNALKGGKTHAKTKSKTNV